MFRRGKLREALERPAFRYGAPDSVENALACKGFLVRYRDCQKTADILWEQFGLQNRGDN